MNRYHWTAWRVWAVALVVWTVALAIAALVLGIPAFSAVSHAGGTCTSAPCPQHPGAVLNAVLVLFGIPSVWLVGMLVGVTGLAASRRDEDDDIES